MTTFKANSPRWKTAKARLFDVPDLTYWTGVIQIMAKAKWLNGGSDGKWFATFDFLLKPGTHIKAMEGGYPPADVADPYAGYTVL